MRAPVLLQIDVNTTVFECCRLALNLVSTIDDMVYSGKKTYNFSAGFDHNYFFLAQSPFQEAVWSNEDHVILNYQQIEGLMMTLEEARLIVSGKKPAHVKALIGRYNHNLGVNWKKKFLFSVEQLINSLHFQYNCSCAN